MKSIRFTANDKISKSRIKCIIALSERMHLRSESFLENETWQITFAVGFFRFPQGIS